MAVATAISRDVTVTSGNGSAGGNGIEAVSSAEAVAPVLQTVTQTNENSAAATFEGSQANLDLTDTNGPAPDTDLLLGGGVNVGLQGQIVGQVNLSAQGGASIATALSDPVNVTQSGHLEAGESGIVAKSSAKAIAPVVQTATQINDNTAAATFAGAQATVVTEPPSVALIGLNRGADIALQGQLVGQVNLSGQFGASVATSCRDDVTVNQFGTTNAWDGDGIAAASTAESVAAVVQTGSQSNSNSAEATFDAGQLRCGPLPQLRSIHRSARSACWAVQCQRTRRRGDLDRDL